MKLLLFGGTGFLSSHIVEAALRRGHEVTIFTRGQTNPDRFSSVEKLRGNRDGDLAVLQGRQWDAVIDTCGYVPRVVRASAELLSNVVRHYTFISSLNAYADFNVYGLDESYPVGTLADETIEEVTPTTYGPLKALSEQAVEKAMPGRVLIIRPGLIVGPGDPTNRFPYWPSRLARGGEVLAADRKDQPVQFIDARDLAEWSIRMVESLQTGIYNATGPHYALTLEPLLEQCRTICGKNASFTWVSEEFLEQNDVKPWTELPLWMPSEWGVGLSATNCSRAIAAGLTFRPVADTIRDTLAWDTTHPTDGGESLKPEREAELLRAWHSQANNEEA